MLENHSNLLKSNMKTENSNLKRDSPALKDE